MADSLAAVAAMCNLLSQRLVMIQEVIMVIGIRTAIASKVVTI
jgi:hypothetical protein